MADGLSRPVILYFSFLVFVLICITGLSVMLIIATAVQINVIKTDIEKASNRNATDGKINQLLSSYSDLRSQIGREIELQNRLITELNEQVQTASVQYASFFDLVTSFKDKSIVKLVNTSQVISSSNEEMAALCGIAIFLRLETIEHDTWTSLELHKKSKTNQAVKSFFEKIEQIMLPVNATILVKPGWKIPTLLSKRSYKMMPNQNEFLVNNFNGSTDFYPVKATEAEYKTISLKAVTTAAGEGQFTLESSGVNIQLNVETILPQIEPNKLGHPSLTHQEITPMIVYQQS